MKAYQALYNPCIWESTYGTLSTHLTKKGAEDVVRKHKAKKKKDFKEMYKNETVYKPKFGEHEAWLVKEIEILP